MLGFNQIAIFLERLTEPLMHTGSHRDARNDIDKLIEQPLLADLRLLAVPFVSAASVVDIFLLLDVADRHPAAMPAGN